MKYATYYGRWFCNIDFEIMFLLLIKLNDQRFDDNCNSACSAFSPQIAIMKRHSIHYINETPMFMWPYSILL